MESANPSNSEEDDHFFDALDDFLFQDCTNTAQSEQARSHSAPSQEILSPTATLRQRRSLSRRRESEQSSLDSIISRIEDSKEKRHKRFRKLKENEKNLGGTEQTRDLVDSLGLSSTVSKLKNEESTVTTANDDRVDDSVDSVARHGDSDSSSLLVVIAGLVIKAVGFQFNLLISFIRFPISVLYCCYMFTIDPFRAVKRCRECLKQKLLYLWNIVFYSVSPLLFEWLKEQKSIGKLLLRFGWGLFWGIYVCVVLCGLLVFSIVISGFCMRYLVEEPKQIKEALNFDYTKNSPVAYVPIMSCNVVDCGVNCKDNNGVGKSIGLRVIPPNHKLQATVSLSLPESEYNRNLGVFQIRVEFLSADGKTLASLRHPCMLLFKSEPIRLLLTFFKIVPLVAGYVSEAQNLNVKMRGFTEGVIPTSCLKVMIEQRAEFRPGAGIPEIYDAALIVESELPLLKRILWSWKKTLFIWIAMMSFMMELLFMLICCRPIIIPVTRSRNGSANNNATEDSLPAQI